MSTRTITRREFAQRVGAVAAAGWAALETLPAIAQNAAAPASGWQIGCFTRPWSSFDCKVALDAIAEAGFKYVGLMTTNTKSGLVISVDTTPEEAAKIGEECSSRGLAVPSCYGGGFPLDSRDAAVAGLKRLIDNAAAAHVADLMMGGVGTQADYDVYFAAIADCCDYAAGKNVRISMKPHGGLNSTGPECRKAIERVGHKNFRIWYDPGNIFYYSDGKLDPVDDAATVDGLVTGMSVKDYQHPKEVALTPGTGKVDFPKVMARLKQGGFTAGPLIIECLTPGDLPKLLEEAKKAKAFIEQLVANL